MSLASPSWRFASGSEGGRSEKGAQVEALEGTLGGENTEGRQGGREHAAGAGGRGRGKGGGGKGGK